MILKDSGKFSWKSELCPDKLEIFQTFNFLDGLETFQNVLKEGSGRRILNFVFSLFEKITGG